MAESGFWQETEWWRNAGYDVLHGTHIGPVEEKWEGYNPLEDHERTWKEKKQERQPIYVELARLDRSDPNNIAYWCGGYGLLGILPHRTVVAHLWPRSGEKPISDGPWYRRDLRSEILIGRLAGRLDNIEDPGKPIIDIPLEDILPEPIDEPAQHPHAVVLGTDEGLPYEVDLIEGVAQFFPDVDPDGIASYAAADTTRPWSWPPRLSEKDLVSGRILDGLQLQHYPMPFTEEFALRYCEPINLFREYAERIERRLAMWEAFEAELSQYGSVPEMLTDARWNHHKQDYEGFQATLSAVSPIAQRSPKDSRRWFTGWRITSLYAAMHVMMLLDFTSGGRYAKACERKNCGRLFVTRYENGKYCSKRCQRTAQVLRSRKRKQIQNEK